MLRLGFARLDEKQRVTAVRRLAEGLCAFHAKDGVWKTTKKLATAAAARPIRQGRDGASPRNGAKSNED
jgi:hypothetical protein